MKKFKYIEDVEAWLEPMDYLGFWVAVAPYDLTLQRREHCDAQLASGEIDLETVIHVLKHMAKTEITQRQGLERKPIPPRLTLVQNQ